MNPYLPLNVSTYLTRQTTLEGLNKQLEKIIWKRGDTDIRACAYSQAERKSNVQKNITILLARFIASLILLSGLINFMKFIIQMFYNRQRELALRKCMGSDTKGLFSLLFAEIFWMMSAAFFLSLAVTEVFLSLMYAYMPKEDMIRFPLTAIYSLQFTLYIVLLLTCLCITIYPVYQLRQLSIINHIIRKRKRHMFRNIMIGLQLTISIFFVGGVYGITISFDEIFGKMYSPLNAEEEKQVISLSVNSIRMQQNMDAILSDISSLSGITDQTTVSRGFDFGSFTYMNYERMDIRKSKLSWDRGTLIILTFSTFRWKGKSGLQRARHGVCKPEFQGTTTKDSVAGTVRLNGADYQIAGTYEALYKEEVEGRVKVIGSIFMVSPEASTYFLRWLIRARALKPLSR